MDGQSARVTLDRIDYGSAFRFTRLFESFRIAIHPSRMLLALLLIIAMFITGKILDGIWGGQVIPIGDGEFNQFINLTDVRFDAWYRLYAPKPTEPGAPPPIMPVKLDGVFATSMGLTIKSFESMVRAAVQLRPGFDQIDPLTSLDESTVVGSLRLMVMIPVWLWKVHPGFFAVYMFFFTLLWSLLGGAISRLAIVEAGRAPPISPASAVLFAARRWLWFAISPFIPLMIVGVCWGILVVGGLLFRLGHGLDILGGFLFIGALALGFVMTILLVGWIAGVHLIYPAISAEGSDGFDAMSRAYSYVIARPWRLLLYSLISLVYGAVTYLLVGLFIFSTIYFTHMAVGTLVGGSTRIGYSDVPYFHTIMPPPKFGDLTYTPQLDHLNWSGKVTAVLIMVWVYLLVGLLGAYAISFYFSSYSMIYLLLRRYTDGTDTSEIYREPLNEKPTAAKDKIEPKPAVAPPKLVPEPVAVVTPEPGADTPSPPDIEEADNT